MTQHTFKPCAGITIEISSATCPTAVATSMIHGTVATSTAKAVKVRADSGRECWIPRSALSFVESRYEDGGWFKLAKWFGRDGYAAFWIDNSTRSSFLSAA